MTTRNFTVCPDVKITNGQADSNIMSRAVIGDADSITLYAPAALDALTFTIQVTRDDPDKVANPTWVTLNNGTADVSPPAAGKSSVYPNPDWMAFKIHASGNVAADRIWRMSKMAWL